MITLSESMNADGITAIARRADLPTRPPMIDPRSDGWLVKLFFDGREMEVPFFMGEGHKGEAPGIDNVLSCLLLDAASCENAGDFDDWCREYGYDTDSRKAFGTYKLIGKQTRRLRRFLGARYEFYLWEVDNDV